MYIPDMKNERIKVMDSCADRMYRILLNYLGEVEALKWRISDRYPFPDLYLRYEEIDFQRKMLLHMIREISDWATEQRHIIINNLDEDRNKSCYRYGTEGCRATTLMGLVDWIDERPPIDEYIEEGSGNLVYHCPYEDGYGYEIPVGISQAEHLQLFT